MDTGRRLCALERKVEGLREQEAALHDCLVEAGLLHYTAFQARLHRRHFAAMSKLYPFTPVGSLLTLLQRDELVLHIARTAGLPAAWAMGVTSLQLHGQCFSAENKRHGADHLFPKRLCVWGGFDEGTDTTLRSCERLGQGRWDSLPEMSEQRSGAAATAIANVAYVCGGRDGAHALNSVERFDPFKGGWETLPPMAERRIAAAVGTIAGLLYVAGGHDGTQHLKSGEVFDPRMGRWDPLPPMREQRASAGAAVVGTCLYVCGGQDGHSTALNTVFCFKAQRQSWENDADHSNQWVEATPMTTRRVGAAAAAANGILYVCGGRDGTGPGTSVLKSAEQFDPETGIWTSLAEMSERRYGAVAVSVDDQLHVCGGYNGDQALSSVERYDPDRDQWDVLPDMDARRAGAAVVALRF